MHEVYARDNRPEAWGLACWGACRKVGRVQCRCAPRCTHAAAGHRTRTWRRIESTAQRSVHVPPFQNNRGNAPLLGVGWTKSASGGPPSCSFLAAPPDPPQAPAAALNPSLQTPGLLGDSCTVTHASPHAAVAAAAAPAPASAPCPCPARVSVGEVGRARATLAPCVGEALRGERLVRPRPGLGDTHVALEMPAAAAVRWAAPRAGLCGLRRRLLTLKGEARGLEGWAAADAPCLPARRGYHRQTFACFSGLCSVAVLACRPCSVKCCCACTWLHGRRAPCS